MLDCARVQCRTDIAYSSSQLSNEFIKQIVRDNRIVVGGFWRVSLSRVAL
jgi:hypothetical protein